MSTVKSWKSIETHHDDDDRLISDAVVDRVIERVNSWCGKKDKLQVTIASWWSGGQRWARNRAFMTSDDRGIAVVVGGSREKGVIAGVRLNQVDDDSLRAACTFVNRRLDRNDHSGFVARLDLALAHPTWEAKGIPVWSDASYRRTAADNAHVVSAMTERAEANGMLSAGFLQTMGSKGVLYRRDEWGRESREVGHATWAQCSSTVRHPKGVGSGWAGASSFDLPRIDLAKLGEIAFDKCMRSMNPVRIEPGRYQTILEPQAVASFATYLVKQLDRIRGEELGGPFWLGYDTALERHRSKLGLQIMDRRINISHDPEDPIIGTYPTPGMRKIDLVKSGVLTSMFTTYDEYALPELEAREFDMKRLSFIMQGTEITTVEDMISTMKRGLLVTRLSDMKELDVGSLLCTGFTRDGLWLIENGKISKAVRNFRWTESPLFILNNVESIGTSVPVMDHVNGRFPSFMQGFQNAVPSVVVPTLKINDFSFTSTVDSI